MDAYNLLLHGHTLTHTQLNEVFSDTAVQVQTVKQCLQWWHAVEG